MSSILHLGFNGNLQQDSFKVFERYYPNQNIMIATPPRSGDVAKINLPGQAFRWLDYGDSHTYPEILALCEDKKVDRILLHSVFKRNINLAAYLKSHLKCRVYWLFWGFELYNALGEDLGVPFVDEKFNPFKIRTYYYPNRFKHYLRHLRYGITCSDILKRAKGVVDYFCFWNEYDYRLYVKYFGDEIKYKYFGYVCRNRDSKEEQTFDFPEKSRVILLNHQASVTGNHFTLMKKVKELDPNNSFLIMMPLSYGSKSIRKQCLKVGSKMFLDKFYPILDYLPKEEYFNIINKPQVALFGQKRQEAAGNIGRLLIVGTKVFLREDNPMLSYYRDKGYCVFSFEKDLNSIEDLNPLTREQMVHNRKVWYQTRSYYEDFMPNFFD